MKRCEQPHDLGYLGSIDGSSGMILKGAHLSMASSPNLPELQKFQAEEEGDTPAGQGGRSRSTSVGSSQKSLPGAWVSPPENRAESGACSSKDETRALEIPDHGLEPLFPEPLSQLPFLPTKAPTFDDFLSPANSRRGSEASPVAPPGLTLEPIQSQMAFWEPEPTEHMEHMEPTPPITPGAYADPNGWSAHSAHSYVVNAVPSMGSASHGTGQCKPCAFHHTKGCACGAMCTFCHLCLPGEKKRRQKEKQQAAKAGTGISSKCHIFPKFLEKNGATSQNLRHYITLQVGSGANDF